MMMMLTTSALPSMNISISLTNLTLSNPCHSQSLLSSSPWLQNNQYHCHICCSVQTSLLFCVISDKSTLTNPKLYLSRTVVKSARYVLTHLFCSQIYDLIKSKNSISSFSFTHTVLTDFKTWSVFNLIALLDICCNDFISPASSSINHPFCVYVAGCTGLDTASPRWWSWIFPSCRKSCRSYRKCHTANLNHT